jgi:hypothetical protein
MLHSLGRAVYRLERFEEALKHSKGIHLRVTEFLSISFYSLPSFYFLEIIRIHENLYGIDHKKTADALGNLASVSFRLKDMYFILTFFFLMKIHNDFFIFLFF